MASKRLRYKSDNLVELNGTVDEAAGTAISAGSCSALIFDDRKDARLSADLATAATAITVTTSRGFVVGDELFIELDDGTYDTLAITAIDTSTDTLTVAEGGLTGNAAKDNRVAVLLGTKTGTTADTITMASYGTPVVGTFDWGWRGTIPDTHTGLTPGQRVRIQIILDGGPGLQLIENITAFVQGGT